MSADVLKSYLVELGWDIKGEQLKKFDAAISGTEALLKRFALQLGTGAAAVAANVMKTAEQLDKLYFAAQRVGTTAMQLQQFSYAAKQIGVSGEEMAGAISAIGIAMRMPGQAGLLRGLGAQSNDAATALDQLIGRLRKMPYFVGQNFAQQFGIGPQAYYQYTTQYDKFHKELQDRQRRAAMAGNGDKDADAANALMTKWRQIGDELGLIEQKVFRALRDPLKAAFGWAEKLLEQFSRIDDKLAAALAVVGVGVGTAGAIGMARGLGRMIFGGGAGAAVEAAAGAELSAAAKALLGSAAALEQAAAALKLGGGAAGGPARAAGAAGAATPAVPSGGGWLSGLIKMLPYFGIGSLLGEEIRAHPDKYPHLQPGYLPPGIRGRLQDQGHPLGMRSWVQGSVMRGGIGADRDASTALRDWLRGTSSFIPRVKMETGPDLSGRWGPDGIYHDVPSVGARAGGSTEGIWNTIKNGAGVVARAIGIGSANAALPPDAKAHMDGIGLGPEAAVQWYTGSAPPREAEHGGFNFAGIRHPAGGFRTYPSEYAGVADAARLLRDYKRKGFDTLEKIINRWAPPSDSNPTETLIARAEKWMGAKRDQPLDLDNPETLSKLLDTMNRNEFGGNQTVASKNLRGYVDKYLAGAAGMSTASGSLSAKALLDMGTLDQKTREMLGRGQRPPGYPADLSNPQAPWNDDKSGALTPGGALGRQSNVTIEMHNDFAVSGFEPADVGREVVRGLGRQNGDLVRNLRSAVG